MPVSTLTLVALAVLVGAPAFTHAQSRVIIKHAYQLERAPAVKSAGQNYETLAAAYVLYDQCAEDLGVADEKKAYLTDKFTKVARAYQIAYQDAYLAYVGASPSQALVDDIAASIKTKQQKTVNNMALSIRNKGCTSGRFRKIFKYVDTLYASDTAPPTQAISLEPRAKFDKKN